MSKNKSFKTIIIFLLVVAAAASAFYLYKKRSPGEPVANNYNPAIPDVVPNTPLADHVLLNVPFVSQAPTGNWADPRQEDGCEETAILMAWLWINNQSLTPTEAEKAIIAIADFETAHYGNYYDFNAQDTAKLMTDYYGYTKLEVKMNPTIEDIKNALRAGKLVLAPANGQKLGNPHYKSPGPLTHFLVIKGFDDAKGLFITNDSGTQYGNNYTYKYQVLYDALVNYPSGHHEDQTGQPKAMIVVSK